MSDGNTRRNRKRSKTSKRYKIRYDRLLAAAAPTAHKLGVARPFQIVPDLPSVATDIRLDGVIQPEQL